MKTRPVDTVNIAQLKARLSHFLRGVRRGRELVVTDRGTPIARVAAYSDPASTRLAIRPASRDPAKLAQLSFPSVAGPRVDTLAFLLEERRER